MKRERSREQFARARRVIPGGVNSPARAFGAVGGEPPFIDRGEGPYLYDVDGNRYLDYVGSWGPLILGHAHPEVVAAVEQTLRKGTSFGAPTEAEIRIGRDGDRGRPLGRADSLCQLGNRSDDERDPRRPRLHQTRQDHQVRRLLSRPCRQLAREGRQRRNDARQPVLARRSRRLDQRHDRRRIQ